MPLRTFAVLMSLLVGTAGADGVTHDPSLEQIPDGEAERIKNIVRLTLEQMKKRYPASDAVKRGVHPKDHGCVTAKFKVSDPLPAGLGVGVFSKPGREFQALVRFSNAAVRVGPDSAPVSAGTPPFRHGSRGMAVKLLGVDGTPLVESDGPLEQDFLMVNHPVFAFANVEDYDVLSRVLLEDGDRPERFFAERIRKDGAGKPDLSDPATRRALVTLGISQRIQSPSLSATPRAYQTPPVSPVDNRYFSAAPYLFGRDAVMKFSAKPVAPPAGEVLDISDPDYLRAGLLKRLTGPAAREVVFEFQVQVRSKSDLAGKIEAEVEDACFEWDEAKYPFVTVATITIPPQNLVDASKCEDQIFTPWHGVKEHQPLGGINRLRLEVYKASATLRHIPKKP